MNSTCCLFQNLSEGSCLVALSLPGSQRHEPKTKYKRSSCSYRKRFYQAPHEGLPIELLKTTQEGCVSPAHSGDSQCHSTDPVV